MDIGKLLTYISYAGLSYRTFKRLKASPSQATSTNTQKSNELKDLLTWVGCTLIIYFQEILDFTLHWIPLYSFWKVVLIVIVFSEKELTLKIFFSFEDIIVKIETWVDQQVSLFTNFSANFSMPMFKLLLTNSTLMIQGSSMDQLKELEKVCDGYLERIRAAKGKGPKKEVKKLTEIRLPSPDDDDVLRCKVGILMKKTGIITEKGSYFPHDFKFNEKTKDVEWVAEGDDKVVKDKLKRGKLINVNEMTVEIEMNFNKKTIQFQDNTLFMKWAPKMNIPLTRSVTHK